MSKKRVARKASNKRIARKVSKKQIEAESVKTSLARAEACTIVLQLVLARLTAPVLRRMHAKASDEARMTGRTAISEEVDCLFPLVLD